MNIIQSGTIESKHHLQAVIEAHKQMGFNHLIMPDNVAIARYWTLEYKTVVDEMYPDVKVTVKLIYLGTQASFDDWQREMDEKLNAMAKLRGGSGKVN